MEIGTRVKLIDNGNNLFYSQISFNTRGIIVNKTEDRDRDGGKYYYIIWHGNQNIFHHHESEIELLTEDD